MIPILTKDMYVNKFVDVKLPSKRQLFGRLGATAPGSLYSGDTPVRPGLSPTEKAEQFVSAAESYEPPKEEVKQEEVKQDDKTE